MKHWSKLRGAAVSDREEFWKEFWHQRAIETPCQTCHGTGVRMYSNTSTWRGGMGGQMCATGICDRCWGSGDERRHGADLRMLERTERQRIAERAATLLAERVGVGLASCTPAVDALVVELQKLARGRKERPSFFYDICEALAKTLCEGIDRVRAAAVQEKP